MANPARVPLFGTRTLLGSHLLFTGLCAFSLLLLFSLLRLAILIQNQDLIGATATTDLLQALFTGIRFDLRVVVIGCLPLILATLSPRAMAARAFFRAWLTGYASLGLLLGAIEPFFYQEFHQRLNDLVFQYLAQDPATVLSMLWHGFPMLQLLLAWAAGSWLLAHLFKRLDQFTGKARQQAAVRGTPFLARLAVFSLCFFVALAGARGTLRQGPPLRWGDAFLSDSVFANQLALNGELTLTSAAMHHWSQGRQSLWKADLPENRAQQLTRRMLLTSRDQLVDPKQAAVRRRFTPPAAGALPVRNLVVILMESFAGHYTGALGSDAGITPEFDRLAQKGLLFTRFFANGTHTHQGMFATMACFPNLPGFEYLMQQPEGSHQFSGLPQLLGPQGFDNLYVYNGDFAWDNQYGFFRNQGMTQFVGRHNFINPVFADDTWGVSDQDMFDRAIEELSNRRNDKPFYALLQTLSNHTPYALPEPLPVTPVSGHGALNDHLTAMRYADWALGRFFQQAEKQPWFDQTLFVIVGDHGFTSPEQLTEMDLYRFYVPLLLVGPGIQEKFGREKDTVGTQVDIVPTILGRLGKPMQHQCWGRDLLNLADNDSGFGVIKPSGGDQTLALIEGDRILVKPRDMASRMYHYQLGSRSKTEQLTQVPDKVLLEEKLQGFVQTATRSLIKNTAGNLP